MKFSEQWLREWVDPSVGTEQLCTQLTMAGLEVDAVEPVAPQFSGVVVGAIVSAEPHPDADKLQICHVDTGGDEPLQIVCGATNARVGIRVPAAVVGAVLPGDFRIRKARLRGVDSFGMLCSARELGLAEDAKGLFELPGDAEPGRDLREYMKLNDVAIELGLTPNRGDCLSIAGIAREVGALNRMSLQAPGESPAAVAHEDTFPIRVDAPAASPRYLGRVIRNIDPAADTPLWMRERLRRSGVRSLGVVVDITNYVMLELGQPMHAFDLAKLKQGIEVRMARAGERLTLLNEQQITLREESLVIADGSGPVALAGIMGGAATAVNRVTRDLFLESAFFTPEAVAGQARSYGLQTDSSRRFERGVDPELQRRAMERATTLLLECCGGEAGPIAEVESAEQLPGQRHILLREKQITRLLGMSVGTDEAEEILSRLGMQPLRESGGWRVIPPTYRFDITIEADLVEELARIHGYDNLPSVTPVAGLEMRPRTESQLPLRDVRRILADAGYQEAITYSFVDPELQQLLMPGCRAESLANPISSDMAVMRTSLWTGLLQALSYNINRQQSRVRLFETGLRFLPEEGGVRQEKMLAAVACGPVWPDQWGERTRSCDFFDLKGDVERLMAPLPVQFRAREHPALHPGQSARIYLDDQPVGWLGTLHPALGKRLDLSRSVVLFELQLDIILQRQPPVFQQISRYPAVRRDLAFIVDNTVTAESVMQCVRESAGGLLQEIRLFDVYQGKGVDSSRKSLAFGLTLQHYSRTLEDKEVDGLIHRVVDAIEHKLGGTLRE